MKYYLRSLKVQLKRVMSLRLALIIILFVLLQGGSIIGYYLEPRFTHSVWDIVMQSTQTGINFFTIFTLGTLVYSHTIASEWQNKALQQWIIRTGIRPYIAGKMCAAAVGGFLCVFMGFILMITFSHIFGISFRSCTTSSYDVMMSQGKITLGFLLFSIDYGFSGAVTAVTGMTASAFIMTPYAAVAAPMVLFLALSRLTEGLKLPEVFNPLFWMHDIMSGTNAWHDVAYKGSVSLIVIILLTIICIKQMERRLQNE